MPLNAPPVAGTAVAWEGQGAREIDQLSRFSQYRYRWQGKAVGHLDRSPGQPVPRGRVPNRQAAASAVAPARGHDRSSPAGKKNLPPHTVSV